MRTALILSALFIADAIRVVEYSDDVVSVTAKIILVFIIADIVEFLVNLTKRSNWNG